MISTSKPPLRLLYVGKIIADKSRKKEVCDAFVDQPRGRELGLSGKRRPYSSWRDGMHWLRYNCCEEIRGDYEDRTHGRFNYKLPVDINIRMIEPGYRPNILC